MCPQTVVENLAEDRTTETKGGTSSTGLKAPDSLISEGLAQRLEMWPPGKEEPLEAIISGSDLWYTAEQTLFCLFSHTRFSTYGFKPTM